MAREQKDFWSTTKERLLFSRADTHMGVICDGFEVLFAPHGETSVRLLDVVEIVNISYETCF